MYARRLWLILISLFIFAQPALAQKPSCHGFGTAAIPECQGKPGSRSLYRVTTLNDGGAGSLRDAVSQGHRTVVFARGGEIRLSSDITLRGGDLLIDGFSAPPPGITIRDRGLRIFGDQGAHRVFIRGLRVRDPVGSDSTPSASGICFSMARGATDIVIQENSCTGFGHGAFNVGSEAARITGAWNLLGAGREPHNLPVLMATGGYQVSFHHNLVFQGSERMPEIRGDGQRLVADVRNNVFLSWNHRAAGIQQGGVANLINNFFFNPSGALANHQRAIYACHAGSRAPQCDGTNPALHGRAYLSGNVSGNPQLVGTQSLTAYLNAQGTETQPFPAAAVPTQDACTAAWQVVRQAGVRPLDSVDHQLIQTYPDVLRARGCPTEPPLDPDPLPPPTPTAQAITETTAALKRLEGLAPSRPLDFAAEYLRQAIRWLQEAQKGKP